MRKVTVFVVPFLFLTSCASKMDQRSLTWDEAPDATERVERIDDDAVRTAAMFSDDACVAEGERLLATDRQRAVQFMKHCLRRDDFMLVNRFSEPAWKGVRFERADYGAILRAALRKGSADDVDLAPFGIQAPSILTAPERPGPAQLFLAYVEAGTPTIRRGIEGVVARPITYEASDRTKEFTVSYDLVEIDTGRVVAEDVKRETVKKTTGNRRLATVLDVQVFLALEPGQVMKAGSRYMVIVDRVVTKEGEPVLAHAVALADAQPR